MRYHIIQTQAQRLWLGCSWRSFSFCDTVKIASSPTLQPHWEYRMSVGEWQTAQWEWIREQRYHSQQRPSSGCCWNEKHGRGNYSPKHRNRSYFSSYAPPHWWRLANLRSMCLNFVCLQLPWLDPLKRWLQCPQWNKNYISNASSISVICSTSLKQMVIRKATLVLILSIALDLIQMCTVEAPCSNSA